MRLMFQIFIAIFIGLRMLYSGGKNYYSPTEVLAHYYAADVLSVDRSIQLAIESQIRLLSALWIATALMVFWIVRQFEKYANILRFVLLGLVLSSIGELISVIHLQGDIRAGVLKSVVQIGICVVTEIWRLYLLRNARYQEIPESGGSSEGLK